MEKKNEVKEENLNGVAGGRITKIIYYPEGSTKNDRCKHCNEETILDYVGHDLQWEDGIHRSCNAFRCRNCGKKCYYSDHDDHMLR